MPRTKGFEASPFWTRELKELLKGLASEERAEVAALEQRVLEAKEQPDRIALRHELDRVRQRYAAKRRRIEVEHGLGLFVGD